MKSVDDVIRKMRRHYPGCDPATAYDLFCTSFKRLLEKAEFRVSRVTLSSFVSGTMEYDLAEPNVRVYAATWFDTAGSSWPLMDISPQILDDRHPGWQDAQTLGNSIALTGATAATPTVITTTSAHGLSSANDGTLTNQVYISGVTGLDDGYYFAKVTGYSTTTFGLYTDISDATGATSTGGVSADATMQTLSTTTGTPRYFYTAGRTDSSANKTGKVVVGFWPCPDATTTNGYPYAILHTESHALIAGSTQLPYTMLDEMYLVYAMCEFWSMEEDIKKTLFWERKRIQEEAVQIEHLRRLIPSQQTLLLPPKGYFSRRTRP